ncbi:MAG TPA: 50S ribosomal protein L30e [Thermoplasmata archaeon]|nr:50S ribosomal protein L30e [Thermoplasmata archaeon]
MIDEARALRTAVQTGKVAVGLKSAREAVRKKQARLVVVASNCPDSELAKGTVKVHRFAGTNVELGAACGKPFAVSALAVIEAGESNILSL